MTVKWSYKSQMNLSLESPQEHRPDHLTREKEQNEHHRCFPTLGIKTHCPNAPNQQTLNPCQLYLRYLKLVCLHYRFRQTDQHLLATFSAVELFHTKKIRNFPTWKQNEIHSLIIAIFDADSDELNVGMLRLVLVDGNNGNIPGERNWVQPEPFTNVGFFFFLVEQSQPS
jgi:hypothetical protein